MFIFHTHSQSFSYFRLVLNRVKTCIRLSRNHMGANNWSTQYMRWKNKLYLTLKLYRNLGLTTYRFLESHLAFYSNYCSVIKYTTFCCCCCYFIWKLQKQTSNRNVYHHLYKAHTTCLANLFTLFSSSHRVSMLISDKSS